MNRQTFLAYLSEPAKLYQMSLVELQGLVLEYPYSANLRLLLLLKARLEDHPRQNEMLAQLSSRTFDREYLYDFMRELEREERQKVAQEERLELPELDKLEFAFPEEVPIAVETPLAAREIPIPESNFATSLDSATEEEEEEDVLITSPPVAATVELDLTPAENKPTRVDHDFGSLISDAVAVAEILSAHQLLAPVDTTISVSEEPVTPIQEATKPTPAIDDHTKQRLRRHRKQQLKRLKQQKKDRIKEIARKSVRAQQDTASETLAKLLAHQGQYAQAIKMYEQLSLLNPEKSAKFAGQIKELKEKL